MPFFILYTLNNFPLKIFINQKTSKYFSSSNLHYDVHTKYFHSINILNLHAILFIGNSLNFGEFGTTPETPAWCNLTKSGLLEISFSHMTISFLFDMTEIRRVHIHTPAGYKYAYVLKFTSCPRDKHMAKHIFDSQFQVNSCTCFVKAF